jgi:hypothetical protein
MNKKKSRKEKKKKKKLKKKYLIIYEKLKLFFLGCFFIENQEVVWFLKFFSKLRKIVECLPLNQLKP